MERIQGHIFDFPLYYDVVFGADWRAELSFLRQCFYRFAGRPVERIYEPACGTGRLLIKLAERGYHVSGHDLCPAAVAFCNARLQRRGFPPAAAVGDMARVGPGRRRADAAFILINSFRHLMAEADAVRHLELMARGLGRGGLYVIGLHLTPTAGEPVHNDERWSGRRGSLEVRSHLWTRELDLRRRRERFGITLDAITPRRRIRVEDEMVYRTYTLRQLRRLLRRASGSFEWLGSYEFSYDLGWPVEPDAHTEDLVVVLRRR